MTCRWCEEVTPGEDYSLLTQQRLMDDKSRQLLLDGEGGALLSVLLHPECLESAIGAVVERFKDLPLRLTEVDLEECVTCGSGVLEGESFVQISLGSLIPGRWKRKVYKEKSAEEGVLCLVCASFLGEVTEIEELSNVSEPGYCDLCTHAACWRDSRRTGEPCPCACHGLEEMDGYEYEPDVDASDRLLCTD